MQSTAAIAVCISHQLVNTYTLYTIWPIYNSV